MKTRFSVQCSEHKPSNCVVANFKTNGLSLIHYSTLLWLRGGTSKWGVDIGRTEKSFFLVQKHYFRFRSLPSHLEGWDWVGEKTHSLCCWCCLLYRDIACFSSRGILFHTLQFRHPNPKFEKWFNCGGARHGLQKWTLITML